MMDMNDTPEEAAFRTEVRQWLSANAKLRPPGAKQAQIFDADESKDRNDISDSKAWLRKKADAGWAVITWPEEYGGRNATQMQSVIWAQEEKKYDVPSNVFLAGQGMVGPMLMTHGSAAQKERYIKNILTGEEVWCQLFSEPGAGSDLAGVRTKAEQDGDEWVINGQKVWTSGGHYSDYGILLARSDPNVAKHKGLSFFIVDMDTPGIEIRPIKQITGADHFNEVFFDNVRIPAANMIESPGDGWKVALTVLMNERMMIANLAVAGGIPPQDLIDMATQTYVNGRPAIEDSSVRQRLADFIARLKAMEFGSARTLTAISKGRIPGPEGSISKLANASLNLEIGSYTSELQGALSAILEPSVPGEARWQELFLGSPAGRIGGGTDEIQRNIIGERILGLPAEPRLDKNLAYNEIPSGAH